MKACSCFFAELYCTQEKAREAAGKPTGRGGRGEPSKSSAACLPRRGGPPPSLPFSLPPPHRSRRRGGRATGQLPLGPSNPSAAVRRVEAKPPGASQARLRPRRPGRDAPASARAPESRHPSDRASRRTRARGPAGWRPPSRRRPLWAVVRNGRLPGGSGPVPGRAGPSGQTPPLPESGPRITLHARRARTCVCACAGAFPQSRTCLGRGYARPPERALSLSISLSLSLSSASARE